MFQNNETAAMVVFQTIPVGVELFSHIKRFLLFQKICKDAVHLSGNAPWRRKKTKMEVEIYAK